VRPATTHRRAAEDEVSVRGSLETRAISRRLGRRPARSRQALHLTSPQGNAPELGAAGTAASIGGRA
jgi:hypothetical protein